MAAVLLSGPVAHAAAAQSTPAQGPSGTESMGDGARLVTPVSLSTPAVLAAPVPPAHGDGAVLVETGAVVESPAPQAQEIAGAAPVPATTPAPEPLVHGFTQVERHRADQLVSAFENSTTDIQYAYAEDIGDGAGVTSGRAGFTTRTGDALSVIEHFSSKRPGNNLEQFVPTLKRLSKQGSSSTSALPEARYIAAWQAAAADPAFRQAQDEIVDEHYFNPAMEQAEKIGVGSPLARAALYDTAVQQGLGGLRDTIRSTQRRVGSPAEVGEQRWLMAYLDTRAGILRSGGSMSAASADRVDALRSIAASGNLQLDAPATFTVYGDTFSTD